MWWRRPAVRVLAAFALIIALGYGIYVPNRGAIRAGIALNLPKLVGHPIEQKLGFATTEDGVRIAYATTGQGPPLVYVLGWATHLQDGFGSPLYDQFGFIVRFSEHRTLVRYDGRGFGMSDRDVTDFSLDARVRDLEAVVDALGLRRFVIMGVSAGGPTAIAYSARHPERVSALILGSTYAGRDLKMTPEGRRVASDFVALIRSGWESPAVRAMLIEVIWADSDEVTKRVVNEFCGDRGGPRHRRLHGAAGVRRRRTGPRGTRRPTRPPRNTRQVNADRGRRELASLIPSALRDPPGSRPPRSAGTLRGL
jgi:pimeloyl-ACP methyl ester carboxylesterase